MQGCKIVMMRTDHVRGARIHAARAFTRQGWRSNVRLSVEAGRIARVQCDVAPEAGDDRQAIVLPALANVHSHAFQRGMAGLTERRGPSADDFWSWREVMYRFALSMNPEQVEAVACQVYVEMLEAGFCRVGEFHYLHHDLDGRPYQDLGEMAGRIAAAAELTGIGLTLLPVFYAHASFGGVAPRENQRRFINTVDSYSRLLERCRAAVAALDTAVVGVAPHSLRAVTPAQLAAVTGMARGAPIHIHIAEQVKEVEDCIAWSGRRPVQWLLENAEIDGRWCLVHATHVDAAEKASMIRSGAVAGLCPITEANLGDGIFDAAGFLGCGGRFGIGSDSNVQVGVADELRLLEYSQRLLNRARNVLGDAEFSTGRVLLQGALQGGGAAVGTAAADLAVGAPADFVSLDAYHPALVCRDGDAIVDAWLFSAGNAAVDCVWVGGEKVVEQGRHVRRDEIRARFIATMQALG
ncbi:MAG TPA: formimidoylglutamate deiminase [Steroidobacteraceae bacterium]|jgi:formiminoglutamate deiminase